MTGRQILFALKFSFGLSQVRRRFSRKKYSPVQHVVAARHSGCASITVHSVQCHPPGGARKQTNSYCEAAAREREFTCQRGFLEGGSFLKLDVKCEWRFPCSGKSVPASS
jgi:hypothetical protein